MSGQRGALERVAVAVVSGLVLVGLVAGVLVFVGYAVEVAFSGGAR